MSSPYTYPQYYYTTPYLSPYYHQPHISPFIPPATFPASPQLPPRDDRRVHWNDDPYYVRQRRPSWHASLAPPPNPVPFPSPPILVTPLPQAVPLASQPPPYYAHIRRASDSCLPQPTWIYPSPVVVQPVPYPSAPPPPPPPAINPLLNGENAGGPLLLFDLSQNTFNPQRLTSYGQKKGTPLSLEELREPATYPPVWRMTITHDKIPDWPVVLEPRSTSRERSRERSPFLGVPPEVSQDSPITVFDVLKAIFLTVQRQISHVDWARLSQSDMRAVSMAYTRRCRTFSSAAAFEEAQGVRRVDYLRDDYMFRGIARENSKDGFAKMKLLTGPAT
ncbi:hypothetical protein PYCCODRAFT_1441083 [Trametes coccinea BRFM310]|uniref:DUF6699 domain-containing protein n=1 Tax=Trametes coccinea (strain BRFM310) TaxID=1353009 RepID=A0A1Y2I5I1_TRAC3|nr:hypothetical protein PYCCODRAFT_1441083 [Trametes coccinea BRFM310]